MKIRFLILPILLFLPYDHYGQGLTGNASGSNSIMIGANNININITDPSINVSLNNLHNSVGATKKIIYGFSATGKNESKFADIFSKGNLASSAKANLFLGVSFSNGPVGDLNTILDNLVQKRLNKETKIAKKYDKEKLEFIKQEIKTSESKAENNLLSTILMKIASKTSDDEILLIIKNSSTATDFKDRLSEELKSFEKKKNLESEKLTEDLETEQIQIIKEYKENSYKQFKAFAFGGINALEFKRFIGWNNDNLSKSISDEYFRGGNIGFGTNYQYKNWLFGISYQYMQTNNFSLLSGKDYIIKEIQSQDNQSITQEKKITAYSGNYGKFRINQLFADVLYNLSLDKSKGYFVLINPYLNAQIFSGNKDIFPDNYNIGSGFYLFNSKRNFLGGFYTQLNDIGNKFERLKPIDDQNLRPAFKRITFGLVATYSFNTIFSEK